MLGRRAGAERHYPHVVFPMPRHVPRSRCTVSLRALQSRELGQALWPPENSGGLVPNNARAISTGKIEPRRDYRDESYEAWVRVAQPVLRLRGWENYQTPGRIWSTLSGILADSQGVSSPMLGNC
mmetsp:Transcript_41677/g.65039  ORF Transcript_41677/g.65039 Transcript_41677/m.65039 type:complete len:125 (+) Transcript_41677:230-604(+)